jgi:RNA polymerase sigma-70 factor, ECF subfamily
MAEPHDDTTRVSHDNLVELAQARNEEAFTTLFSYYSPGICGYLAGLMRSPEDRDELAQETFCRAWEELPRLREVSRFKPWLYRIATNLAYDYIRHQRSQRRFRWLSLEDCHNLDSSENLEEHVIEHELVRQILKEFPWKYRTCLLLEIEGKLTRREIAEVVGIRESSVTTYISNARQRFRQAYDRLQKERDTAKERRLV